MTRHASLARQQALLDALFTTGGAASPEERALLGAVLARFAADRLEYSDIFECSLSQEGDAVDRRRFSYAFPGFRRAPERVAQTVLEWGALLGPAEAAAAQTVLRAARHRAVEQVLFGYARGVGGQVRAKYYLQFSDAAGGAALELARAMIGTRQPTASDALRLHLLGLDVGPGGLVGAKLYFERAELPAEETAQRLGWPRTLRRVLLIHRLSGADGADFETPSELDFAPGDSGLGWDELATTPVLQPFAAARAAYAALAADFRLRARRVSVSLRGPAKTNVYYVLDEPDAGAIGMKPPGGG